MALIYMAAIIPVDREDRSYTGEWSHSKAYSSRTILGFSISAVVTFTFTEGSTVAAAQTDTNGKYNNYRLETQVYHSLRPIGSLWPESFLSEPLGVGIRVLVG